MTAWASGFKRARIVRAWKRGRLGFGFSAGGLLFPYYAGVISEFRRLGIMPSSPSDLRRPHLEDQAEKSISLRASKLTTAPPTRLVL